MRRYNTLTAEEREHLRDKRRYSENIHITLNETDKEMIGQLAKTLGSTRTDAVRTAIRVYYAILSQSGIGGK